MTSPIPTPAITEERLTAEREAEIRRDVAAWYDHVQGKREATELLRELDATRADLATLLAMVSKEQDERLQLSAARLKETEARTRWIPVAEGRWPEPWNADVLCWDEGDGACVVGCLSGFRKPNRAEPVWIADINGEVINLKNVTHWMPLPARPLPESQR